MDPAPRGFPCSRRLCRGGRGFETAGAEPAAVAAPTPFVAKLRPQGQLFLPGSPGSGSPYFRGTGERCSEGTPAPAWDGGRGAPVGWGPGPHAPLLSPRPRSPAQLRRPRSRSAGPEHRRRRSGGPPPAGKEARHPCLARPGGP